MPRPRNPRLRYVQATHLKFLGVTSSTTKLYKSAMHEFCIWRKKQGMFRCSSYAVLDRQLGEFFNYLYQAGMLVYKAASALSGLKRLLPQCRRSMDASSLYFKNWVKSVPKTRALPLKADWVRAFVAFSHVQQEPLMGLLLVLGFLGLFRVSEVLDLHFSQLTFVSERLMHVVLVSSKGAKLNGSPELVKMSDKAVSVVLKSRASKAADFELVFPFAYKQVGDLLRAAATRFGLPAQAATTHCLRRGGATWHFEVFASYDLAAEHGRWRHVKDCRTYINSAMADVASMDLSQANKEALALAAKAWPAVLRRLLTV